MLNNRTLQFGGQTHTPDRLVRADCVDLQGTLPDSCLDLIYIDPPFGTGTTRKNTRDSQQQYRDLPDNPEAFIDWIAPCLTHSRRLLNATGSLFVHLDHRAVHYVKVCLDRIFGRNRFVNEIIWCYSVGGKSNRRFARKHDTILWYSKQANYAFYPEAIKVPRKASSHMRVVLDENGEEVQEKTDRKTGKVYRYPIARGKIPEDWWSDIETLNRSAGERVGWPTQKPSQLLRRIVQATTDSGDTVADWFSGSGTTAVVAQALSRAFIVTDRETNAIACAEERLQQQGQSMAQTGSPPSDISMFDLSALPETGTVT